MNDDSCSPLKNAESFFSRRRLPSQDADDLFESLQSEFLRRCQNDRAFDDIVGDFAQGFQLRFVFSNVSAGLSYKDPQRIQMGFT